MSNSKGRCFRSPRRTKRRRARQAAAAVELKRRNPDHPVFAAAAQLKRPFEVGMLAVDDRFQMMSGFGQILKAAQHLRRGGRRGS